MTMNKENAMTKEENEKYSSIKVQYEALDRLKVYITTIHDIRNEYKELEVALKPVEKELCNIYKKKENNLVEKLNTINSNNI